MRVIDARTLANSHTRILFLAAESIPYPWRDNKKDAALRPRLGKILVLSVLFLRQPEKADSAVAARLLWLKKKKKR